MATKQLLVVLFYFNILFTLVESRICHVTSMGFRIFSKIVIALGVVLVAVVILEFMLLTLYVKEQDVDVVKATLGAIVAASRNYEGLVKFVNRENSENFTPSRKESKAEREQFKHGETQR